MTLEAGGEPDELRRRVEELRRVLAGADACVDEGDHGFGATVIISSPGMEDALHRGLATLRSAERDAGLSPVPLVTAEVVAAGYALRPAGAA